MKKKMKRFMIVSVFLFLFPAAASAAAFAREYLQCVVLDVGEGQAVLFQRGDKGILVDTGHFGMESELKSALDRYGVTEVEAVILTHLHPDHASGIFALMSAYPRAVVYESGHRPPFDPFMDSTRWVALKLDSGSWNVRKLRQPDSFIWRGVRIDVLWPRQPLGNELNGQSLVLSLSFAGHTVLIMGDVGMEQENMLIQEQLLPQNISVLVVGHHGALDATGTELLNRVNPETAVISVDSNNMRGYPDEKVVKRLQEHRAKVHLTSEQGDFVWRAPVCTSD
jgi:competence protein ComEC